LREDEIVNIKAWLAIVERKIAKSVGPSVTAPQA
jgi:hypothetical protein